MGNEKRPHPGFHTLFTAFRWKPIYGCPGRYILKEDKQYTLVELIGNGTDIKTFSTKKAQDMVCVAVFNDGGIISYKKDDGSFVHTLNNQSGFLRKLKELNITLI